MVSVGKGMLADGIGCFSSGLLGGLGTSMSAANVGLSMATGATSRRIGYYIGFFFLLLSPQLDAGAEVYRFLENQGATWGARQQVIHERAPLAVWLFCVWLFLCLVFSFQGFGFQVKLSQIDQERNSFMLRFQIACCWVSPLAIQRWNVGWIEYHEIQQSRCQ